MQSHSDSDLVCLDLQLQQLSVYASQRRLCTAAALFTVVQVVQDGLQSMTRPRSSIAAEVAMTHKVTSLVKLHVASLTCELLSGLCYNATI